MILISHRGNIDSIIIKRENTQSYIQDAIDLGYDVEIDVWYVDFLVHKSSPFWLGHDEPQCEVEVDWLLDRECGSSNRKKEEFPLCCWIFDIFLSRPVGGR